jgi:hypothetical protein
MGEVEERGQHLDGLTTWKLRDWRKISLNREDWRNILEKSELNLDCCAGGGEDDDFHM